MYHCKYNQTVVSIHAGFLTRYSPAWIHKFSTRDVNIHFCTRNHSNVCTQSAVERLLDGPAPSVCFWERLDITLPPPVNFVYEKLEDITGA